MKTILELWNEHCANGGTGMFTPGNATRYQEGPAFMAGAAAMASLFAAGSQQGKTFVDVTATRGTWEHYRHHLHASLLMFKPPPGMGYRVRVELVDARELEALEKDES